MMMIDENDVAMDIRFGDERVTKQEKIEKRMAEHMQAFLGFVQKRVNDPELARDILQDSFLKAMKASDQLQSDEQVIAWFYRILRRSIIDGYRRRATSAAFLERLEHELESADIEEEKREICACFEPLLPTLKSEYATALRRVDLEEHPLDAVAASLGITPNNLKVRLHRARQQLKERLLECCGRCAEDGCLDCSCN